MRYWPPVKNSTENPWKADLMLMILTLQLLLITITITIKAESDIE